jgi:hypothetical protein
MVSKFLRYFQNESGMEHVFINKLPKRFQNCFSALSLGLSGLGLKGVLSFKIFPQATLCPRATG